MGKRKVGRCIKNAKKNNVLEPDHVIKAPHSFVINRGRLGKNVNELLMNFRKLMEPYTASTLKVQKQNVLKDFVHMAGPLNVTHLVVFTKSEHGMYLRIIKLPHGPTLTFQIKEYSLVRDVISSQKKSLMYDKLFEHHPLLVLNNFSGEGMHFKLMTTTFQNMFPSINVNKTNLNTIRRCLLVNYNDDKTIDLRQYAVKVVPTGLSKAVKKLIQSKVPNLSQYGDIDEFLQKSGNLSESEVEMDTPANTVVLPQPISSRGNITSEKSAIRLYEIGPRLKLQLIKIEDGLMTGEVLFHEIITRSPEEVKALKLRLKAKKLLKEQRKSEQQKNVQKKAQAKRKETDADDDESSPKDKERGVEEEKEDIDWYRQEVGDEPDEGLLPGAKKRKNTSDIKRQKKKVKFSKNSKQGQSNAVPDKQKPFQDFLMRRKKRKEAKNKNKRKKSTKLHRSKKT